MNTIILESNEDGEQGIDVYAKLANNRIIFLNQEITDSLTADIIATLLVLDQVNNEKITLFINCYGGNIRNIFTIYDTMKLLNSPLETICVGSVVDESVILLSSGTVGMRVATKNSSIVISSLINEDVGMGNLADAEKLLELHKQDHKNYLEIIAKTTGKTLKQVKEDFKTKTFLSANQALKYGLIDKVV